MIRVEGGGCNFTGLQSFIRWLKNFQGFSFTQAVSNLFNQYLEFTKAWQRSSSIIKITVYYVQFKYTDLQFFAIE